MFFVSCSVIDLENKTPLAGMSVGEAWLWIDRNIEFKSDFVDDFQLPETTYRLKTGDCEDFCILLMSVMNAQGPAPELVCISLPVGWHYVVFWKGEYYEPQVYGKKYTNKFVSKNFLWSFSYKITLNLSH